MMDGRLQVKQYVAEVQGRHSRFRVFETADSRFYLFAQVDPQGCDTGLQVPIRKADLQRDVRSALRNGWGHSRRATITAHDEAEDEDRRGHSVPGGPPGPPGEGRDRGEQGREPGLPRGHVRLEVDVSAPGRGRSRRPDRPPSLGDRQATSGAPSFGEGRRFPDRPPRPLPPGAEDNPG